MTEVTEPQVTLKSTIDQTIENFGIFDVVFADVSLSAFKTSNENDDPITLYNAIVNLHFDDSKSGSHQMVSTITDIIEDCKYCAASKALSMLEILYGNISPDVMVFDENGDVIEEFDLFDSEHGKDTEDEYVEPTTEEHITNIKKTIASLNESLANYESKLES
jgi:hypothetical protein